MATFWNAGDEPCRILEIISPGGFEHFFREMGGDGRPAGALGELSARYGIEADLRAPRICAEHGLTHPLLEQLRRGRAPGRAQSWAKTDFVSR